MALGFPRIWLPALLAAAGIGLTLVGGSDDAIAAGVVLIGGAILVAALSLLFRYGVRSNVDREREEAARRYFDRHGRWPGQ